MRDQDASRPLTFSDHRTIHRQRPAVAVRIRPIARRMLTQWRRRQRRSRSSRTSVADRRRRGPRPRRRHARAGCRRSRRRRRRPPRPRPAPGCRSRTRPRPARSVCAARARNDRRPDRRSSAGPLAGRAGQRHRVQEPARPGADPREPLVGRRRRDQRHEREPARVARRAACPAPPRAAGRARSGRSRRRRAARRRTARARARGSGSRST